MWSELMGAIEETVHPELCVITIGLVGFGGGLLLGDIKLLHSR